MSQQVKKQINKLLKSHSKLQTNVKAFWKVIIKKTLI